MQHVLLLLSSLFLGLVCYYSVIRMHADLRKPYLVLLAYRFLFFAIQSFLFCCIYKNQLDPFFYHQTLITLFDDFKNHPWDCILFLKGEYAAMHIQEELKIYLVTEIRAAFFIKVLSPFFAFSANNYYLLGAWLTFFGSVCMILLLSLFKHSPTRIIWLLVLLIPSFTFWTVGVLKEAFVLPALLLLFYFLNTLAEHKGKHIVLWIVSIILVVLVWKIKYYLAALFLFFYLSYYLITYTSFSKSALIFALILFLSMVFGLGYFHPALNWNVLPEVIYISNQLTCTKYVHAYTCIPFDIDMTWNSIFLSYPKAIAYAFFLPFPWQIHNFTSLLAALENYAGIVLVICMIYRLVVNKTGISVAEVLGLCIVLLLGGLLIIASPNIGSFSRYRIFYLPIYAFILFNHSGLACNGLFFRFKNWIEK